MIAFPFRRTRRDGSTWRPVAPAIEQFVEWSSPKSSEFLASPGGKLPGLTALRNRQDWLMRGGDRLVNECSWMSDICSRLHHSTYCCGDFKRSPPLISLFCQSVPKCRLPKNPASPRGKPRGSCGSWFHSTFPSVPSASGSPIRRPLQWRCKTMGIHPSTNSPSEVEPRTLRASEESPLVASLEMCYTRWEEPGKPDERRRYDEAVRK